MAEELSALGIKVTSDGVVKTTGELERFAKASNAARAAAKTINVKVGAAGMSKAVADIQKMDKAITSLGGSSASKAATATKAASTSIVNVGNAARQANAHVMAYRNSMVQAERAAWEKSMAAKAAANADQVAANRARAAAKAEDALANSSRRASAALKERAISAKAAATAATPMAGGGWGNQSNPANIAAQFQDIGVTAAMGMNPMMIALQQGTQLSTALAGGIGNLGKAIAQVLSPTSLLTIALVALSAVGLQNVDWMNLAQSALNGLADILPQVATAAAYVGGVLLIAFGPQIIASISATAVAIGTGIVGALSSATSAMIAFALANPFTAFILAVGAALAAVVYFRDDIAKLLGTDVVATIKNVADTVVRFMVAAFNTVKRTWDTLPDVIHDAWQRAKKELNELVTVTNTGTGETSRLFNFDVEKERGAIKKVANVWREEMGKVANWSATDAAVSGFNGFISSAQKKIRNLAKGLGAGDGNDGGGKALSDAAKIANQLADNIDKAYANVGKLAQEMENRNRDWGKSQETLGDQMIRQAKDLEALEDARAQGARQVLGIYLQQLDAIGRMRGAFGPLAGILEGMATGNFSGVGGKIGGLLGLGTGKSTIDPASGRVIAETIGDKMKQIFDPNGTFFQGLSQVLANAAIGSTAANLTGGSKLGGALGGALGGKLGEKFLGGAMTKVFGDTLGKTLGSFAGPLGSMLGGVLGGAIGGLFKKAKYGTAGISMNQFGVLEAGVTGGNSSSREGAAKGAAGHVIRGIEDVANALGAAITGVPNITIGTYKDKYRVSTAGYTGKLDFKGASAQGLYDFGKDGQQDAIAFAVQKAIEGGVITGISQASINILKSGQDLQRALEKATLIESVPKELQKLTDPIGYAVNEVNDKFVKIVAALREGGASAEQMAQAQQLYNLELAGAKSDTNSAAQAMKDFLKSMNMGSSSPLSLRDQALSAQNALDPYLSAINAGQAIDQSKYLDAAQTYLDIQRQMFGSTAKYFEAFNMIQDATNKAISTADNVAPIRTEADPFIEETANATRSMQADTSNMVTLLEKIRAALEDKTQNADGSFIGTTRNYG